MKTKCNRQLSWGFEVGLIATVILVYWLVTSFAYSQTPYETTAPSVLVSTPNLSETYRSVGQIRTSNCQGSGTLIAVSKNKQWGLLLSCEHVCQYVGNEIEVDWYWAPKGPVSTAGRVIWIVKDTNGFDTDLSIALVELPKNNPIKPVKVARFTPIDGPWQGVGFRKGELHVSRFCATIEKQGALLILPTAYLPGMSGGPMLNSKGEIVAVVVASDFETKGVSVDDKALHDMIDRFRN